MQAGNSCSSPSFAEDTEKLGFGSETYSRVRKDESLIDLGIIVDSGISWNVYELLQVESAGGFFISIVEVTSETSQRRFRIFSEILRTVGCSCHSCGANFHSVISIHITTVILPGVGRLGV